jgi:hypothetical protein
MFEKGEGQSIAVVSSGKGWQTYSRAGSPAGDVRRGPEVWGLGGGRRY